MDRTLQWLHLAVMPVLPLHSRPAVASIALQRTGGHFALAARPQEGHSGQTVTHYTWMPLAVPRHRQWAPHTLRLPSAVHTPVVDRSAACLSVAGGCSGGTAGCHTVRHLLCHTVQGHQERPCTWDDRGRLGAAAGTHWRLAQDTPPPEDIRSAGGGDSCCCCCCLIGGVVGLR